MSYAQALDAAWKAYDRIAAGGVVTAEFLAEKYTVSRDQRSVMIAPGGAPARDYVSVILLHYLTAKFSATGLPRLTGDWIDFRELPGGEGYYPAFRKRTIDILTRKFSHDPKALIEAAEKLRGEASVSGDASTAIRPVPETLLLLTVSKADDEFGPDANILFDRNVRHIFCTEDIVVMTETVVRIL